MHRCSGECRGRHAEQGFGAEFQDGAESKRSESKQGVDEKLIRWRPAGDGVFLVFTVLGQDGLRDVFDKLDAHESLSHFQADLQQAQLRERVQQVLRERSSQGDAARQMDPEQGDRKRPTGAGRSAHGDGPSAKLPDVATAEEALRHCQQRLQRPVPPVITDVDVAGARRAGWNSICFDESEPASARVFINYRELAYS